MDRNERLNMDAEFLPQTTDDERPAIRIGDALVFVYYQEGVLRVTVDTEDEMRPTGLKVNVNSATVWEGYIPTT